jgi:hypothetical protein
MLRGLTGSMAIPGSELKYLSVVLRSLSVLLTTTSRRSTLGKDGALKVSSISWPEPYAPCAWTGAWALAAAWKHAATTQRVTGAHEINRFMVKKSIQ